MRDGIDRVFTDAESYFRDVLSIQLGTGAELVNQELQAEIVTRASQTSAQQSVDILDAIKVARNRIDSNVRDLLVLEALCTRLIFRSEVAA